MLQEKEESSMSDIKNLQAQLAELESKNVLLPVRSVDDHIYSEYLSKAQVSLVFNCTFCNTM